MQVYIEAIAGWIEIAGVGVIVAGMALATVLAAARLIRGTAPGDVYVIYRARVGRSILLGLEFLIAGDIIQTILIDPTLASAGALALIVLIRTFLSFSLETEIEGRPPWRRAGAGQ